MSPHRNLSIVILRKYSGSAATREGGTALPAQPCTRLARRAAQGNAIILGILSQTILLALPGKVGRSRKPVPPGFSLFLSRRR